ncbi:hypothetical protein CB1_000226006 [Camelus ferus]|nr:hypothetical protein CB1_000226006 [Camelus ferus]
MAFTNEEASRPCPRCHWFSPHRAWDLHWKLAPASVLHKCEAAMKVHTDSPPPNTPGAAVGMDPALAPVTGLHHWVYLQLAPSTVHVYPAGLTLCYQLPLLCSCLCLFRLFAVTDSCADIWPPPTVPGSAMDRAGLPDGKPVQFPAGPLAQLLQDGVSFGKRAV